MPSLCHLSQKSNHKRVLMLTYGEMSSLNRSYSFESMYLLVLEDPFKYMEVDTLEKSPSNTWKQTHWRKVLWRKATSNVIKSSVFFFILEKMGNSSHWRESLCVQCGKPLVLRELSKDILVVILGINLSFIRNFRNLCYPKVFIDMNQLIKGRLKHKICKVSIFTLVALNVLKEFLTLESMWEHFLIQLKN